MQATHCDFRRGDRDSGSGDGDLVSLHRWRLCKRLTVIFAVSKHRWRLCKRLTVIFVVGIGKWRQRPCQPASLEILQRLTVIFVQEVEMTSIDDLVNLHRWILCNLQRCADSTRTPCTINHEHWSTMKNSCVEKHEQTIGIGEPYANHEHLRKMSREL